jgi:spore maturation protein CgeB
VGSCLLTDWKSNINELFEEDKEIVTYKSKEECVEKMKWLLENSNKRESIAKAGQERVIREHTYKHRADELVRVINKYI